MVSGSRIPSQNVAVIGIHRSWLEEANIDTKLLLFLLLLFLLLLLLLLCGCAKDAITQLSF